jgi:hypothetical protein
LTLRSGALTARVFSEGLHFHCFVSEDRADSSLLRGIQFQCLGHHRHPPVDHLTWIHSHSGGRSLSLRILPLRAGAACERETPDNQCSERETPSSVPNLPNVHSFLIDLCCNNPPALTPERP